VRELNTAGGKTTAFFSGGENPELPEPTKWKKEEKSEAKSKEKKEKIPVQVDRKEENNHSDHPRTREKNQTC